MNWLLRAMALMLVLSLPAACNAKPAPAPTPKAENPAPLTPQAAKIKVISHPDYQNAYSLDPAAAPGRM